MQLDLQPPRKQLLTTNNSKGESVHISLYFTVNISTYFFISDTYTSFVFYSRGKKTQLPSISSLLATSSPPTEEPSTSTRMDRLESDDEENMGFFQRM